MKRLGERITLTYVGLCCPPLEAGDVIQTSTGRRYEVLDLGDIICRDGREPKQKLSCVVMRPSSRIADDTRILHWQWLPRKSSKQ